MEGFKRLGMAGVLFAVAALTGYGQYAVQSVSLAKGWNAVYLQLEPADPRCEVVFADWPVASVSLHNMARAVARYTENPDEPLYNAAEFLTWTPGLPAGANSLNSVIAGQAYLIVASASCTRNLSGRPAVPRIDWVPSTNACNLVGFRQNGSAQFGSYLAGAGFDMAKLSVYSVSGTNAQPTLLQVGGFSGLNTALIVPGKAYFIACDTVSTFAGPVKVFPAGTGGICFPSNGVYQTLRMKNEHGAPLAVTLTLAPSAAAPSGDVPALPTLLAFDYLEGWLPLTTGFQRTLAAGEEWTLPLAVDRTGMLAGQAYGGVLVCTDAAGGRVEVPLAAEYGQADATHARWPSGLWVGKASLNQVSQVLGDGTVVDGAKAGGLMEFRLILHVDADKRCRLLQRVILAGEEETNGTWNASLYVDEKKVPPGLKGVRISSVAFGVKNDITWDETYGGDQSGFGKNLRFTYAIAADDPVNPFRHPYHPDHDGWDSKFKNKLPFGDDPKSYIGEIKPELFSISNTVTLAWTNTPAAGGSAALWNPSEKVGGDLYFQVDGLRREGAILMKGLFEMRRISQVGTLSLE